MCGIAAILGDPSGLLGILPALRHRGPDGSGTFAEAPGWLGAHRLRVNGDARGDMPLHSRSGNVVLVANGEVFNHRALGGTCGASDLAGLADAFEREGTRVFSRIRGPFAACVYDRRDRSLTLARDEIGVRPLFFREDPGRVAVASEIPALRRGDDRLDPDTWAHLVAFQFWPEEATPFAAIRSVMPGSWRRYRIRGARLESEVGAVRFEDADADADAASALATAFDLQARGAGDAALFLSGGLDSSAVAGLLAATGSPPARAAVGWFPGAEPAFDERPHARAVARELDLELLEIPIRPADWLDAWQQLVPRLGGPLAGPGGPSQWIVARALAAAGTRVVFTGQGGDELFGGYERHRLLGQLDRGERLAPAVGYEPLARAMAEGDPLQGALFRGRDLLGLLEPEARLAVQRAAEVLPSPGPERAERTRRWERRHLLPGLLAVDDRVISAFGMEGRVPLLDPAFVARVEARPNRGQGGRAWFRELVGESLPFPVRQRTDKMGFPLPLGAWFRGPLAEYRQDHPGIERLSEIGFTREGCDRLRSGRLSPRTTYFLLSAAMTLAGTRPASSSCAQQS